MKLIPRLKSISFMTIFFNFASPKPQNFHEVEKYIENFEFVTDDISVPKDVVTERAFIGDYFESPRRNVLKNNDEKFEAIKREYLKELEEHKAKEFLKDKPDKKIEEVNKSNVLRKSLGRYGDERLLSRICGADKTETLGVIEGAANIESFPWLGVLVYPRGKVRLITTVILVTINTVIGSALDIERLPKLDFRKKSKVILGHNCKHPGINVLDYNYHPDYGRETYSSVVLVQIDLASVSQALWPICGPPKVLKVSKFYTITLPNDCRKSKVEIFSMDYVKPEVCKSYYRRAGLDLGSIWPKHGACGRAHTEDECVWRNGAALVVKQRGRWHLMGIGVNGPGCAAPSRYVDYAAYNGWVTNSVARIGRPALTRLADNHLILRRTLNKIQRYGPCDANEIQTELFCDRTNTTAGERDRGRIRYNLTLIENYDYTCIALKANSRYRRPKISLKGICDSPHHICYSANRFVLDFYVEIAFFIEVWFKICVYGKLIAAPDPKGTLKYFNRKKTPVPIPWGFTPTDKLLNDTDVPPFGHGHEVPSTVTTISPTIQKDNDTSYTTSPESTGDEFGTTTPIIPKDDGSVTPTDSTRDEWTLTPTVQPKDNESTYPTLPEFTGEFWTLTPVVPQDNGSFYSTPPEPTGDFWTITPIVSKDNDSSYPTAPEPTGEFWTIIPVVPKDNESSYPTAPEPTGEFWTITPVVSKDNGSSYPTSPEATGEFWIVTPIMPKDTESPYDTLPEPTGEFWIVTPIMPKDTESPYEPTGEFWIVTPKWPNDTESPYVTPPEPTGEFWVVTPKWPVDTQSPYVTPPEPTSEFWIITPKWTKDIESPHDTLPEPIGDFWSVTPKWPKDTESPDDTSPEPIGEFWSITPKWPIDTKLPNDTLPQPTGEFWIVTPKWPEDTESPNVTPPEPTGEFWIITPKWPKDTKSSHDKLPELTGEFWIVTPKWPKDSESSYVTPPEPTGESWSITPKWPIDTESPYITPPDPTGEFWIVTPKWPKDTESPHDTMPEPTGEFWIITPKWPKDTESPYVTPPEPTAEFWSITPKWPIDTESPYVTPPESTGEFWIVTPKWPKDTHSPHDTLPEQTGEFWIVTPKWPKDTESPYVTPAELTSEFWNITPFILVLGQPTDKYSVTVLPSEPFGEFWLPSAIPKDGDQSSYAIPIEPTGELFSLTPIDTKDEESSIAASVWDGLTGEYWSETITPAGDASPSVISVEFTQLGQPKDKDLIPEIPTKSTGEFWLPPVISKKDESSFATQIVPTVEIWSVLPIELKDEDSTNGALVDLISEISTITLVTPADNELSSVISVKLSPLDQSKDRESSNAAPVDAAGNIWSITGVTPAGEQLSSEISVEPTQIGQSYDKYSITVLPTQPTGEFWLPSVISERDESSFITPIEPIVEVWSLPSTQSKDDESSNGASVHPTGESWSVTLTTPVEKEYLSSVISVEPTTLGQPKDEVSVTVKTTESTGDFWLLPVIYEDGESSFTTSVEPTVEIWSLPSIEHKDKESSNGAPLDVTGKIWSSALVTPADYILSSVISVEPTQLGQSNDGDSLTVMSTELSGQFGLPPISKDDKSYFATPTQSKEEESLSEASVHATGEFWSITLVTLADDESPAVTSVVPTPLDQPKEKDSLTVMPTAPFDEFWLQPVVSKDHNSSLATPIEPADKFWSMTQLSTVDETQFTISPIASDDLLSILPITTREFWRLTPAEPKEKLSFATPMETKLLDEGSSFASPVETINEFWTLPSILFTNDEFSPVMPIEHQDDNISHITPFKPTAKVLSSITAETRDKQSSNGTPKDPTYMSSLTPFIPTNNESMISAKPNVPENLLSATVIPIQPKSESWSLTSAEQKNEESSFGTLTETREEFWSLKPSKSEDKDASYDPTREYWTLTPIEKRHDILSIIPVNATVAIDPEDSDSLFVIPIDPKLWNITPAGKVSLVTPVDHTSEFSILTSVTSKSHEQATDLETEPTGAYSSLTPVLHKDEKSSSASQVGHVYQSLSSPTISPKIYESQSVISKKLTTESWIITPFMHNATTTKLMEKTLPKDHKLLSQKPPDTVGNVSEHVKSNKIVTKLWSLTPIKTVEATVPVKPQGHDFLSFASRDTTEKSWSTLNTSTVLDNPKDGQLPMPIPPELTDEWNVTPVMPKDEKPSPAIPIELPDGSDKSNHKEPTVYMPVEAYPVPTVSSDTPMLTDQTVPTYDKNNKTDFTEDPLKPWWIDYPITTTASFITTDKDALTPGIIGVTDDAYDSYQPWWTEGAYIEVTDAGDVFTKHQEALGTAANLSLTSHWMITPVNKASGVFMPPDGDVLMVTPEYTIQEEKVTSHNEPKGTEEFNRFWAATQLNPQLLRNNGNRQSLRITKPSGLLGIVSEKLENQRTTKKTEVNKTHNSITKNLKTVRPEYVYSLFGTRNMFKNKIENTSAKRIYPLSVQKPLLKKEDPEDANQLEKFEKTFEDIINVTLFPANLNDSTPRAQNKLKEKKTEMATAKNIKSPNKKASSIKIKENIMKILAVTPVTMPLQLKMVTAKIVSSEEKENRGEILRMSMVKEFNGKRVVKSQTLPPKGYRQPKYLKNIVTRRQTMTHKSGLRMKQAFVKWNRPKKPGGFL